MQATLFDQGVTLMLVGMGTVFVFLTALVIAMTLLAAIVRRLTPVAPDTVSDEEVAAITAAIAQHRNKHS
ncbi:MAG: OadG family protein [Woeseiaceae bacterium]|nr:OadG family protein [Woeseiaceae bacterium]